MKTMKKPTKNELWCATYVVKSIEDDCVVEFGNLHSAVYTSREAAWKAIVRDLNNIKGKDGSDDNALIMAESNRVEYSDEWEMRHYIWELQKMRLPKTAA